MILLAVEGITKHFGPDPVLAGASFEVRASDKIGLVGPNGAGKTTLMKCIAGHEEPDSGHIELPSSTRIGYLEQQPQFEPGRTLWDEAAASLASVAMLIDESNATAEALAKEPDGPQHRRLAERFDRLQHEIQQSDAYRLESKIEQMLEGLGFQRERFRQPVGQLSGGMQNRLLLAKLLLSEPSVLLLDEPSNHLDIETTAWLEDYLARSDHAMVIVSHDRYFLDKVTNRTCELFRGTVESYVGNFSAYWRQKTERLKVAQRTYDKQQEFVAKTEDFIRRNHYGQKHAQAEDRRKKLERIERVEPPREIAAPPMGFPAAARSGDIVLRAEHLSKAYAQLLFNDLSFDVLRGERWGILGPNGSGKTTLLYCLLGMVKPDAGNAFFGAGVSVGYFDQHLSVLDSETMVVDAIRPKGKELTEPQRRSLLARFGIKGDMVFQRVDSLSGGERNRAALAYLAASDSNLLVLDEPTNHLDLWARDALERSLTEFDGTVILVSHDRYFLNRVVDHLLVIGPEGVRIVIGNYDASIAQRAGQATADRHTEGGDTKKEGSKQRKSEQRAAADSGTKRKRKYPYRKVADLEADIFRSESRIAELHTALSQPETLRDGQRVRQLQAELAEIETSLSKLYEHWEEASELN